MSTLRAGTGLSVRGRRQSFVLSEAALLASSAAVVWVGLAWLEHAAPFLGAQRLLFLYATAASSVLLGLCAVLSLRGARGVPLLLFLAWAGWGVSMGMQAGRAPVVAFLAFAWAAVVSYIVLRLGSSPRLEGLSRTEPTGALWSPSVLFAGAFGLVAAALAVGYRLHYTAIGAGAVLGLLLVPAAFASLAEWSLVRRGALRRPAAVALSLVTLASLALFVFPERRGLALALLALRSLVALAGALRSHELHHELTSFLWRRPALLVVVTFVLLCAAGGIVLKFPACTTRPIALLDACFTAVSAACVTGLIVLDTPVDFTVAGQIVLLLLIQVGGLGIMSLSAFATLAMGRSLGSDEEQGLSEVVGAATPRATIRMVRAITVSTLVIEGIGAAILWPAFWYEGESPLGAAWKGLFHAVSAFCNAGFALQSDSLIEYRSNPLILYTTGGLIVLGGLGFGVLAAVADLVRRRERRIGLHPKLVLATSAGLLVLAAGLFLALEWTRSLAGLSWSDKLHNACFQGITFRTAGFNSVDFARLGPATVFVAMIFMFIGASPASTGGGIKTTTAAVLVLAVRAVLSRSSDVQAFGRRISVDAVFRAAAVAALSAALVLVGCAVLLQTQASIPFASCCFEVVSAFGTVGLSVGATAGLDPLGKIVVMMLMLAGRTGPLTMAVLFQLAPAKRLRYTPENVMVG